MRTIKLYENFGQDRLAFTSKISRHDTDVTLYDEPMGMRNALINEGVVNWDLDLSKEEWGISPQQRSDASDIVVKDIEGGLMTKKKTRNTIRKIEKETFTIL